MNKKKYVIPDYILGKDIKEVRCSLGLTQREFAQYLHCSKPTVERWEVSTEAIRGPIVVLIDILKKQPDLYHDVVVPTRLTPVRLWYMHEQTPCTMIDVDDRKRNVTIKNFTEHLMFRAFGVNESPTYAQYEEFLESRCFPRTRDKMKLMLQELNIPFYDPFLIIEKTEGRMAEDHFWIKIER